MRIDADEQPSSSFDFIAKQARAERVFLDLLDAYSDVGQSVSPNISSNYAPTVFAKDHRADGLSKQQIRDAMNRLFDPT